MRTTLSAFLFFFLSTLAYASQQPVKTFVEEFRVVGAPQQSELKTVLPAILSARLNPEIFSPVEKKESAEIQIFGSYVVFGKIFTLDATVKDSDNGLYLKTFEQGEKEEDIPAAIGRLAEKLAVALEKGRSTMQAKSTVAAQLPHPAVVTPVLPVAVPYPPVAIVQPTETAAPALKELWNSELLEGAFSGITVGKSLHSAGRELFIVSERELYFYQMGKELRLISRIELPKSFKIIGIDSADLDNDGITEIYVTAVDRGTLSSLVFIADGEKLEKIAESLPYFFRSFKTAGNSPQIYVQEMGVSTDYFGDISELVKNGKKFTTKHPIKLPESVNIHNFNRFETDKAKQLYAVYDSKGYLRVKSEKGDELWQSTENFGGSESYFKREAPEEQRSNLGEEYRWVFLQQRIFSLPGGTLLLPRNDGTLVVGNIRSYNRHSLHLLKWNGSSFKELTKTPTRPGYLADYSYDPATKELITLEVTQKKGMTGKGKSVISILAVEQ